MNRNIKFANQNLMSFSTHVRSWSVLTSDLAPKLLKRLNLIKYESAKTGSQFASQEAYGSGNAEENQSTDRLSHFGMSL